MPRYKILKHFPNSNNWKVGDVVDITDAKVLLEQGFVGRIADFDKEKEIEEEIIEEEVEEAEEVVLSKKWKKKELVAYAEELGLKVKGTKSKIVEAIKKALEGGE